MSIKTHRKDHGADKIRKVANEVSGGSPYVAVGIIGNKEHKGSDLTVAQIATFHEFGTERIPQRSFLRSTFRENRTLMNTITKDLYKDVIFKRKTVHQALAIIGEKFVSLVKAKIVAGIAPPLSPKTIAKKGSSTPLVDTGQLLNSISYKVYEHGSGEE